MKRIVFALASLAGLLSISPKAFTQSGHVQLSNWFEITKTPVTCMGSSVTEIDGKLYMIGGELFPPNPRMGISDVRIYDIGADEWSAGTEMPTARPLVPKLNIGTKIYAIGGSRDDTLSWNRIEVYDISTDKWTRLADMPTSRRYPAACVYDEKIYVFGGLSPIVIDDDSEMKIIDYVERYDPSTDTWDTCAPMITERCVPSACVLNDSIYLIGGIKEKTGDWPGINTVEVYDPLSDKWAQKRNMHITRSELTNVVLDGKIYAIGGFPDGNGRTVRSSFEVYDPETDTWTLHSDPEDLHPQGAAYHAINVDDRMYVLNAVGPYTDFHPVFPEVYVYNEPILKVKSDALISLKDTFVAKVLEPCMIYIVPPGTPAKEDSIIQNSIASFDAREIKEHKYSLDTFPPGNYLSYAVAMDGRIDLNYFEFLLIDHFPACILQIKDQESLERIPACTLVLNGKDTIPETDGVYDLTGLAYDTCNISIIHPDYFDFDTYLIVRADTSFVISLASRSTWIPAELKNREFRIYPNPTHDLINIQTRDHKDYFLEIISLSGKVLDKMDLSENSVQMDLSSYQSGVYLIRIIFGDIIYNSRIVKY